LVAQVIELIRVPFRKPAKFPLLHLQKGNPLSFSLKNARRFPAGRVSGKSNPTEGVKRMKRKLVKLLLVALLLSAWGATPALAEGGGPVPLCFPGTPCPIR